MIEAATGGFVSENVFSEISQNTQENTFAQVSFLIKVQDYEIFKNIFDVCFCIETSLPSFKPPTWSMKFLNLVFLSIADRFFFENCSTN